MHSLSIFSSLISSENNIQLTYSKNALKCESKHNKYDNRDIHLQSTLLIQTKKGNRDALELNRISHLSSFSQV